MQINLVLPDGIGLGGVTTWSIAMANALAKLDCGVTLLEHVNQQAPWTEFIDPAVRLIKHSGPSPCNARCADVLEYVASYRQALPGIMIPNYEPGTFAACAVLSQECPTQMRVIAFAHSNEQYYYNLLCYYEPLVHRFVAVSREVGQHLVRHIPHRAADIVIRPYGIAASPTLDRTWTPPHQPLRLMYAGRLVEKQKRVSDLARLAKLLTASGVNFQLDIVGDGEEKQRLADVIGSSDDRVRLLGRIPHPQILASWHTTDICILVSEYEGTSIAMLEAMAAGCVPVVTAVSGAIGTITPGTNGYLLDVGDMKGMAEIIQRLAADRSHVAYLGRNAYQTARSDFSFDAYVDWFLSLIRDIEAQPARLWPRARPVLPPQPRIGWLRRTTRLGRRVLRRLYTVIKPRYNGYRSSDTPIDR